MIKKEEYLKALDIVLKYHNQIKEESEIIKKTPVLEWVLKTKPSSKLSKLLTDNPIYTNKRPFEYMEDISLKKIRKVQGLGPKTLDEFVKLYPDCKENYFGIFNKRI